MLEYMFEFAQVHEHMLVCVCAPVLGLYDFCLQNPMSTT
jgi:hypothetical protein